MMHWVLLFNNIKLRFYNLGKIHKKNNNNHIQKKNNFNLIRKINKIYTILKPQPKIYMKLR